MTEAITGIVIGIICTNVVWGLWSWRYPLRYPLPGVKPIADATLLQEAEVWKAKALRYRVALVECAREAGEEKVQEPIERYAVERVQQLAGRVK